MLTWFEEDTWALLVGEKSYDWRQTPYTDFSKSVSNRKAKLTLHDDGLLEGDVVVGKLNGQTRFDVPPGQLR